MSRPMGLIPNYASGESRRLNLYCRDPYLNEVIATDEQNRVLFRVRSDHTKKRTLFNAQHMPIWHLSKKFMRSDWRIESSAGFPLAEISSPSSWSRKADFDMYLSGQHAAPCNAFFMRQNDSRAPKSQIFAANTLVAEITLLHNKGQSHSHIYRDHTVWSLDVSPWIDLSMVVAFCILRAEQVHNHNNAMTATAFSGANAAVF